MSDVQKILLRIEPDLIKQIDARAENLGISRNQWFENMTRWVLANTFTIESRGGTVSTDTGLLPQQRAPKIPEA